jgi:hypothetical protein
MAYLEYEKKDCNILGAVNELKAAIWLLEQGYQVFMNVKGVGPADMVAWSATTNETKIVDVKTMRKYQKKTGEFVYNTSLGSTKKKKPFVSYLGYCPDDDIFKWLD